MDAVAIVAVLLPTINWVAAVILVRAARVDPPIPALTERAATAVLLAVCSTLVALLAANRLVPSFLPRELVITAFVVTLLGISLPAGWWLWLWERDQLGDDG